LLDLAIPWKVSTVTETLAYILVPVLLLALTLWLTLGNFGLTQRENYPRTIEDCLVSDQQLLDDTEQRIAEYDAMLQRIRGERHDAAMSYLEAVRGDYLRVEHLLTHAAKFLPELTLKGETARLALGIRFRIRYRLARLQVRLGFLPSAGLKSLAAKLRLAAAWADDVLDEISRERGLPVLESDLKSGR
jgi:hypothetical protein